MDPAELEASACKQHMSQHKNQHKNQHEHCQAAALPCPLPGLHVSTAGTATARQHTPDWLQTAGHVASVQAAVAEHQGALLSGGCCLCPACAALREALPMVFQL